MADDARQRRIDEGRRLEREAARKRLRQVSAALLSTVGMSPKEEREPLSFASRMVDYLAGDRQAPASAPGLRMIRRGR
jgi:hypothetical protein